MVKNTKKLFRKLLRNALWMIYLYHYALEVGKTRSSFKSHCNLELRDAKKKYAIKLLIRNWVSSSLVALKSWKTNKNMWIAFANLLRGLSGFMWRWIPKVIFTKGITQKYFMSLFCRKLRKLFKLRQKKLRWNFIKFYFLS